MSMYDTAIEVTSTMSSLEGLDVNVDEKTPDHVNILFITNNRRHFFEILLMGQDFNVFKDIVELPIRIAAMRVGVDNYGDSLQEASDPFTIDELSTVLPVYINEIIDRPKR